MTRSQPQLILSWVVIYICNGRKYSFCCAFHENKSVIFYFSMPVHRSLNSAIDAHAPVGVCWRHWGKNPWTVEEPNWALGLCRDRGRFSWETGTVQKAGQPTDTISQGREGSHYQHFKERFSGSLGVSGVWLGVVLAPESARQYPDPNTSTLHLWGDVLHSSGPSKPSAFAPR